MALSSSHKTWLADSGCTLHIAQNCDIFIDYVKTPGHQIIGFEGIDGLSRGTIKLESTVDRQTQTLTRRNVVHAPKAPHNLILISHALEAKIMVLFKIDGVKFHASGRNIIMEGQVVG